MKCTVRLSLSNQLTSLLLHLQSEQRAQRVWSEYCHRYYFAKDGGQLSLSASLEDTMWACAMVSAEESGDF